MDHDLFHFINQTLANPFLDAVLPVFREKTTWIPLYLLMVFLLYRSYGWRRTLWLLLCIGAVMAVADQFAANVLKPWVGRLRPCAEPEIAEQARILVSCGGKWSFPSNHATNHFALAMVLALTWLKNKAWGWKFGFFLWAGTIALAQVYVGKHYPGDIFAGAILGSFIAGVGVFIYRRFTGEEAIPNPAD